MTSYVPEIGQDGSKAVLAAGLFNRPGDALRPVWPVRALTGRVRTAGFDLVQVLALPLVAVGSINKVLRFPEAGVARIGRELPPARWRGAPRAAPPLPRSSFPTNNAVTLNMVDAEQRLLRGGVDELHRLH